MSKDLIPLLEEIAEERGVEMEMILEAIEAGLSNAARKKCRKRNLVAKFDVAQNSFALYQVKRVQEVVNEEEEEITIIAAAIYMPDAEIGDEVGVPFDYPDLGRLAAMSVRKAMGKSMAELKLETDMNQLEQDKYKMYSAVVAGKSEEGDITLNIGGKHALLPKKEQMFREDFAIGDNISVISIGVEIQSKQPVIIASRTHPILLGALFMREVPEISEGHVIIKGVARDTGGRAKIAVFSKDSRIDPVGACIGPSGKRVRNVIRELSGENVDVIAYDDDPAKFIANCLTPAKIDNVTFDPRRKRADVMAEPEERQKAIGKGGMNIRLACRITRYEITVQ